MLSRLLTWASLRTLIIAAGLPFAILSLGSACLDYAGEDWGIEVCDPDAEASAPAPTPTVGSGSGSGIAIPTQPAADCGTPTPSP